MFLHYMYVDILFPLTKAILIMFKHIITHYKTLQTWIDHNATSYHNFNVLLHVIAYLFTQFSMVWGYLQRVTMRYR